MVVVRVESVFFFFLLFRGGCCPVCLLPFYQPAPGPFVCTQAVWKFIVCRKEKWYQNTMLNQCMGHAFARGLVSTECGGLVSLRMPQKNAFRLMDAPFNVRQRCQAIVWALNVDRILKCQLMLQLINRPLIRILLRYNYGANWERKWIPSLATYCLNEKW